MIFLAQDTRPVLDDLSAGGLDLTLRVIRELCPWISARTLGMRRAVFGNEKNTSPSAPGATILSSQRRHL